MDGSTVGAAAKSPLGQQIPAAVHEAQAARGAQRGHSVRDAVHAVLAANGIGRHGRVTAPEPAPTEPTPVDPAPVSEPTSTDTPVAPGTLLDISA